MYAWQDATQPDQAALKRIQALRPTATNRWLVATIENNKYARANYPPNQEAKDQVSVLVPQFVCFPYVFCSRPHAVDIDQMFQGTRRITFSAILPFAVARLLRLRSRYPRGPSLVEPSWPKPPIVLRVVCWRGPCLTSLSSLDILRSFQQPGEVLSDEPTWNQRVPLVLAPLVVVHREPRCSTPVGQIRQF